MSVSDFWARMIGGAVKAPDPLAQAKAAKLAHRQEKVRSYIKTIMVGVVRDKHGRPKFDGDPRQLPDEMKRAYAQILSADEYREFFG